MMLGSGKPIKHDDTETTHTLRSKDVLECCVGSLPESSGYSWNQVKVTTDG